MPRRMLGSLSLALGLALLLAQPVVDPWSGFASHRSAASSAVSPAQRAAIASQYGQLPLSFQLNAGQDADPSVQFLAQGSGYTLALAPSEALLALTPPAASGAMRDRVALPGQPATLPAPPTTPPSVLGMRWLGANPDPVVTGEQPLPGTVNYFLGNDPSQWRTNVPTYQQVRLHDVYPGIDLVYYGNAGQLEYDFVVAPGADPTRIALGFTGAQRLGVDLQGNLTITLPGGSIAQQKPLIYQAVASGVRQPISGSYSLASGTQRVGFTLGAYNPRLPLVIDPAYKFSTYLGGSGEDGGQGIVVDGSGNAYVTGYTGSTNFPTTGGVFHRTLGGTEDAFVSKLNAAGSALVYSTYLGGSGSDFGNGIAVDSGGNAYITGGTFSTDFPTTAGAFQTTFGGSNDAFVTKLNATGSALVYSTYLGGSGQESGSGIAADSGGNAFVTGYTYSANFPTSAGAFQTTFGGGGRDAFITKLNATGSALVYSTYLGGSGDEGGGAAITLDGSGNAYVTGGTASTDFPTTTGAFQTTNPGADAAFVTKLNPAGAALVYSTYLGGGAQGNGIAAGAGGTVYVTGYTGSANFPTTVGAFQTTFAGTLDAFVTKLNATGSALVYSTYLGGSGNDEGEAIAVDAAGNADVTGVTNSSDFPTANALQSTYGGGGPGNFGSDAFVTHLNATGTGLLYSSYLGGSSDDRGLFVAVNTGGDVYLTGITSSTNIPIANPLYGAFAGGTYDAFVTKLSVRPTPIVTTGVFRPSNGNLYLKNSNSTGFADLALTYGLPGDKPVTGDWTGKGYKSIGVDRAGKFLLRNTNTTGFADITASFGNGTDLPVAGDWTGKGYDSIGVFRNGTWYLRNSNTTGLPDITLNFGAAGDLPVVGDWTGKGYESIGVFRPSLGAFFLRNSNTTGAPDITVYFGASGDLPVAGDWTAKKFDSIGIYRNGTYFLRNSNTSGGADISFTLGVAGDQPITGPWLAPVGGLPPHQPGTPSQPAAAVPRRATKSK